MPETDAHEEALRLGRAARSALAEAEARWRRELGAAAKERSRLRDEIRALKGQDLEPAAKKARVGAKPADAPLIGHVELYAKYHAVEESLRTERDKSSTLETQLSRLIEQLQTQIPVLKERSERLETTQQANASLSERLTVALRERSLAHKVADELRVEASAARAALDELSAGDADKRTEAELRTQLHSATLGRENAVKEAVSAVVRPPTLRAPSVAWRGAAAVLTCD